VRFFRSNNQKPRPNRWGFFVSAPCFPKHLSRHVRVFLFKDYGMPDKDPNTWAAIWLAVSTSIEAKGAAMASAIAVLRVLYDGKEARWTRIILESLICGGLSMSATSVIRWGGLPDDMAVAVGGAIGFIGVTALRDLLMRVLIRKVAE
jgi:lambda family phage holin